MDAEEKKLENEVDKPEEEDGTDMPSGKLEVSNWDIFHMVFSILTSVIDIGLDINMAAQYLIGGHTMYFVYTLVLILLPSFINSVVSSQMHRHDQKVKGRSLRGSKTTVKRPLNGLADNVYKLLNAPLPGRANSKNVRK